MPVCTEFTLSCWFIWTLKASKSSMRRETTMSPWTSFLHPLIIKYTQLCSFSWEVMWVLIIICVGAVWINAGVQQAGSLQPSLFESKDSQWGPGAARTFCCFLFSLYNIAEKITRSFTHSRLWVPFLFTHPWCVKCFNRFSISPSAIIVIPLTWNLLLPTLCSLTLIYSLCSVRAKQKKKPVHQTQLNSVLFI